MEKDSHVNSLNPAGWFIYIIWAIVTIANVIKEKKKEENPNQD